ncbi:hypothetical protein AJ87_38925 [Rhizobium yanglingense]|nr:hypothetical protein AJ87_38925 [Rhizobium yanglingense]
MACHGLLSIGGRRLRDYVETRDVSIAQSCVGEMTRMLVCDNFIGFAFIMPDVLCYRRSERRR